VEQPGLLEEDGAASRGGVVAAGRRRNQRAKGSGRSLFVLPEREGLELEGKSWDGDERKWGKSSAGWRGKDEVTEKGRLVCSPKSQALGWREDGKNLMKDGGVAAPVGGEEKMISFLGFLFLLPL